jgi:hypothetical protein
VIEFGRIAAAGKSAARHSDRDRQTEADERSKGETEVESPDTRIVLDPLRGAAFDQRHVQRPLLGDGHRERLGLQPLGELAVTRWQPDPSEDRLGSYIFLRDASTGNWWSATAEPKSATDERAQTLFSDDKASFFNRWGRCARRWNASSSPKETARAGGSRSTTTARPDRHIEVTSFAELVLGPRHRTTRIRPSKMFVETEIAPNNGAIFATRRKRNERAGRHHGAFRHRSVRIGATPRRKPTGAPSSAVAVPSSRRRPSILAPGLAAIPASPGPGGVAGGRCACLQTRRSR